MRSTSTSRAKTTERAAAGKLTVAELVRRRVIGHGIAAPRMADPVAVVRAFGAMQAQDHHASKWAVGVRVAGGDVTDAGVEAAIDRGDLVRTHPLRNTIHLVARDDVRWMLALTRDRMRAAAARRYRELGLDAKTLAKAERILTAAMAGGTHPSRGAIAEALARGGVDPAGQRLVYVIHHAELAGLVCSGRARGFALLDERVPAERGAAMARGEAAARLAERYFAWRGPATADDYAWWSGLAAAEARAAVAAIAPALVAELLAGATYYTSRAQLDVTGAGKRGAARAVLLPAFDEYAVAYRDRRALAVPGAAVSGFQLLSPTAIVDGRAIGKWSRERRAGTVAIAIAGMTSTATVRRAITAAAARYAAFLGLDPVVAM